MSLLLIINNSITEQLSEHSMHVEIQQRATTFFPSKFKSKSKQSENLTAISCANDPHSPEPLCTLDVLLLLFDVVVAFASPSTLLLFSSSIKYIFSNFVFSKNQTQVIPSLSESLSSTSA